METAFAIELLQTAFLTTALVLAPLLLICLIGGIAFNLLQVATSIQDPGFSAIPRFTVFLVALMLLLPWMLSRLVSYFASMMKLIAGVGQ